MPSNITLFDSYGVNGANTLDACFNTQNSSNRITDADLENLSQYVN